MTPVPRAVSHFGLAALEARAVHAPRLPATRPTATPAQDRRPQVEPQRRVVVRLWFPTTAFFLLLAPFALLLAPCIYLCTPPPYRTPPFATALGLGRVLLSLGGTVVHVDTPEALVSIRVF